MEEAGMGVGRNSPNDGVGGMGCDLGKRDLGRKVGKITGVPVIVSLH